METKGLRLSAILNREIDAMTDDDTNRGDVISRMGTAAGISASTVNQILGGAINCPPLGRLRGFARVLGVTLATLQNAAEADGCEYGDDGKAVSCIIVPKFSTPEEYRAFSMGMLHKMNNDKATKGFENIEDKSA